MMARTGGIVAFVCCAWAINACGGTTRNDVDSDTSTAGPATNAVSTNTTGSGGATTQGVTAAVSTTSETGTGGTTTTGCPSFEPAAGSTCSEEDQICGYEHCVPPDYNDRHLLTCIQGAWTLTDVSACPVQPCPATPPALGSVCYENVAPEICTYANACGAALEVACVDGTWQTVGAEDRDAPVDPAPPVPTCPAYPPYLGEPCCPTTVPETCDYSATATGSDGAAGASFLIAPTGSTSGGGAEPPLTLTCARCTPQMTWDYCSPK